MSGGASPKQKGSRFERDVCVLLSKWVSHGKRDDLFWRSAMSGGRATLRVGKHGAQGVSGDICAVHPQGHDLTDYWHVECKHVQDIGLATFILKHRGFLANEWARCRRQADAHNKIPMLIAKQNLLPTVALLPHVGTSTGRTPDQLWSIMHGCVLHAFDDLLATPYDIPRMWLDVDEDEDE